jgi:hypothetical protein
MANKVYFIKVQGIDITMTNINQEDYISITDMIKAKDGDFFISDWLRNANTLEYLCAWETLNNPNFNYGEFAIIRNESGVNSFKVSVKEWVEKTNAIGITAKAGRYGGTYAHKDIAFNFGMWISPVFQLYVVKEYQRLKEIENNQYSLEWNVKRILSKVNYQIHTDAIKTHIIPKLTLTQKRDWVYADEADMLNIVLFGCTAKQWREANQQRALNYENIRDMASIIELAILSNLETLNSSLIKQGIDMKSRMRFLHNVVKEQRKILDKIDILRSVKKLNERTYADENITPEELSEHNKSLTTALNYNPNA